MNAAIDIGTNTVLLLIADYKIPPTPLLQRGRNGDLRIIRDEARITRLGQQLHALQLFPPAAMKRTLAALKEYKTLCDHHQVKEIAAVGTAAFRRARNAEEFTQEVLEKTGIRIEIISGEEEACLSYASVLKDFGDRHKNLMALDIGGGSTEIISVDGAVSLPLGCVELTERFLTSDPVRPTEIKYAYDIIENGLAGKGGRSDGSSQLTLVALAGTATTLSAINQKLPLWDPAKIQGSIITKTELDRMTKELAQKTIVDRKKITGMVPERADTLLAGAMILQKVMEQYRIEKVLVSDRGLRFGLFYKRFIPNHHQHASVREA
ncbi:MAG: Ppx/GppA family phosphatase [Deltaproteobacteria bacterium]|nr:Ppx/GppA family phosphatase [Deltaproteobacteria bacterium]